MKITKKMLVEKIIKRGMEVKGLIDDINFMKKEYDSDEINRVINVYDLQLDEMEQKHWETWAEKDIKKFKKNHLVYFIDIINDDLVNLREYQVELLIAIQNMNKEEQNNEIKVPYELLKKYGNGKLDEPMTVNEFTKVFSISLSKWEESEETINEYDTIDKTFTFTLIKDGEEIENETLTIEIDNSGLVTHLYYYSKRLAANLYNGVRDIFFGGMRMDDKKYELNYVLEYCKKHQFDYSIECKNSVITISVKVGNSTIFSGSCQDDFWAEQQLTSSALNAIKQFLRTIGVEKE